MSVGPLAVREDIRELSSDEIATSLDTFARVVQDDMAAPRTAETLAEAAKRLRGDK